ncbi:MAG: DUF3455 domain-containing protein [Burkholderiaceae bacterium]|nr:DUF3455 domain-containing protein [Burkholderiaceae bacterium]
MRRHCHAPAVVLGAAVALAGCAAAPEPAPPASPVRPGSVGPVEPPALGFFSKIRAPDSVQPTLRLSARGVQVFRCEPRGGGFAWVFRLPEAELLDAAGRVVGRHGANFSFEHTDGSRLLASVLAFDEAPRAGDLRWLLLSARSFGQGVFAGVTHVQRVNTVGGMPPARCEAGQQNRLLRIDFSADFVFYKPR